MTFLATLMTTAAFGEDANTSQDVFGQPSAARDHDRYLVVSRGLVLTSGLVGQTVYNGAQQTPLRYRSIEQNCDGSLRLAFKFGVV